MTNRTVNLNKLASELCGEMPKVRVRVMPVNYHEVGSTEVAKTQLLLQIRPTDRKIGKGLPKGEVLFDLKTRADRGTKRFVIPEGMFEDVALAGGKFLANTTKHGWISLAVVESIPSEIGKAAPAGASVTDK